MKCFKCKAATACQAACRAGLRVIAGCIFCMLLSCVKVKALSDEYIPRVRIAAAEEKMLAEEVSGFGSLTFLTKVDVNASQDGVIRRLYYREGTSVPRGAKIAELENPQIELAVGRAENAHSQAAAALKLARSRLLEGEFRAEAEILSIAKAEAEFAQAKKFWKNSGVRRRPKKNSMPPAD